jgi:putative oxidoreductase
MHKLEGLAIVAGRILIAQVFIVATILKASNFTGTAGLMTSAGVPMAPVLLSLSLPLELVCAAMIILGWKARWAALVLSGWLIVVTPLFHGFWHYEGLEAANQLNHFLKNVSLLGALLFIVGRGPGTVSLDHWFSGSPKHALAAGG